jgi:hypothetical protein
VNDILFSPGTANFKVLGNGGFESTAMSSTAALDVFHTLSVGVPFDSFLPDVVLP